MGQAMNQENKTVEVELGVKTLSFSWPKLLLFGASSVVLSSSVLLAVFNSFPLALAGLFFGRTRGALISLLSVIVAIIIWGKFFPNPVMVGAQVMGVLVALGLQESFLRGVNPMKGVLTTGMAVISLVLVFSLFLFATQGNEVKNLVSNQVKAYSSEILKNKEALMSSGEEDNRQALDLLERPDVLTEQIMQTAPVVVFTGALLWPWVNMLILLRLRRSYLFTPAYPFFDRQFINYHVPQWVLIPTLAAMALTFFGDMVITPNPAIPGGLQDASAWGKTALQMVGVLYFFQGMGIYLDFLDTLNFRGPLRHLLVLATVISGPWVIALFGLFDLWVNFRRFFQVQPNSSHKKGE